MRPRRVTLPHRLRVVLSVVSPGEGEVEKALFDAFDRLARRAGVRARRSTRAVGCLPSDGITHYVDVSAPGRAAWTYWGTDYGHPLEAELAAETEDDLRAWLAVARGALAPTFEASPAPGPMPAR